MNSQKGIALFQILLITIVLTVLAVQFTQTAKNQISIAQIMSDRVAASVELKSIESELIYSLLTEQRTKVINSSNPIVSKWNFHNKKFSIGDFDKISIQDEHSLITLYLDYDVANLTKLLNVREGSSEVSTSKMTNSLVDWQDSDDLKRVNGAETDSYNVSSYPRNLPVQSHSELSKIQGFTKPVIDFIEPLTTYNSLSYFNPMNAPTEILNLLIDKSKVENIILLRDNGRLSKEKFSQISGLIEDEAVFFGTGNNLKVKLEVLINNVHLTKTLKVSVNPYIREPYIEYETRF